MENLRREGSPACRRMDVLSTEHLALPQVSSQPRSPYLTAESGARQMGEVRFPLLPLPSP